MSSGAKVSTPYCEGLRGTQPLLSGKGWVSGHFLVFNNQRLASPVILSENAGIKYGYTEAI
jgi:hypothetical protein